MRRRWIGLLILFLATTTVIVGWWRLQSLEHSQDRVILAASRKYGVDPALIKAVVWRESRFNPRVRGKAGEVGLMQLRDEAALEWAGAERLPVFEMDQLLDPSTNTLAGTWYLRRLLVRYLKTDNPIPYALADYNAGRTHVLRWAKGLASTNSAEFLQQIDFPGTRRYIDSIMARHAHYRVNFRATPRLSYSTRASPDPGTTSPMVQTW